jgi:hypothetical protein
VGLPIFVYAALLMLKGDSHQCPLMHAKHCHGVAGTLFGARHARARSQPTTADIWINVRSGWVSPGVVTRFAHTLL